MSYLKHCNRVRQSSDEYWRVQWRSTRGTVRLTLPHKDKLAQECHDYDLDGNPLPATLYYPRYTKLGELLHRNHESERKYIADAIEQHCGIRPTSFAGV